MQPRGRGALGLRLVEDDGALVSGRRPCLRSGETQISFCLLKWLQARTSGPEEIISIDVRSINIRSGEYRIDVVWK